MISNSHADRNISTVNASLAHAHGMPSFGSCGHPLTSLSGWVAGRWDPGVSALAHCCWFTHSFFVFIFACTAPAFLQPKNKQQRIGKVWPYHSAGMPLCLCTSLKASSACPNSLASAEPDKKGENGPQCGHMPSCLLRWPSYSLCLSKSISFM